jgi:hypothetical protein
LSPGAVRGSPRSFAWQNRRVPIRHLLAALACPALVLAGCGNSRTPVPNIVVPAKPNGNQTMSYPAAGVSFRAPRNWTVTPGKELPLVATVTSGHVQVALWRYPRKEPLPATAAALEQARSLLVKAAHDRSNRLRVLKSKVVTVNGAHAIELNATERVAGAARRVRSVHVFAHGAEFVLDEYAPLSFFRTVDHQVFSPLKRSLKLVAVSPK